MYKDEMMRLVGSFVRAVCFVPLLCMAMSVGKAADRHRLMDRVTVVRDRDMAAEVLDEIWVNDHTCLKSINLQPNTGQGYTSGQWTLLVADTQTGKQRVLQGLTAAFNATGAPGLYSVSARLDRFLWFSGPPFSGSSVSVYWYRDREGLKQVEATENVRSVASASAGWWVTFRLDRHNEVSHILRTGPTARQEVLPVDSGLHIAGYDLEYSALDKEGNVILVTSSSNRWLVRCLAPVKGRWIEKRRETTSVPIEGKGIHWAFTPDGKQIAAFVAQLDNLQTLYIVEAGTGKTRCLGSIDRGLTDPVHPDKQDYFPSGESYAPLVPEWTLDGKCVYFILGSKVYFLSLAGEK